jgi:hypothetical protein
MSMSYEYLFKKVYLIMSLLIFMWNLWIHRWWLILRKQNNNEVLGVILIVINLYV